jgi:DNA-directed RNA polymerase specialized sigma24 family protein
VLLLVGVEQLRPVDAATVCGISPEALRQRLSRARGSVSRLLENHDRSTEANRKEVSHDARR